MEADDRPGYVAGDWRIEDRKDRQLLRDQKRADLREQQKQFFALTAMEPAWPSGRIVIESDEPGMQAEQSAPVVKAQNDPPGWFNSPWRILRDCMV